MSTEFAREGLRSSESSQNSAKRKSFENDENDENESSNKVAEKETPFQSKKLRSKDSSTVITSDIKVDVNPAAKTKSSLPRFQVQPKTKSKVTMALTASTPGDKKRLTEQNTTERLGVTPCKTPVSKPNGQVQNTISKFEGLLSPAGASNQTELVLKKLRSCFQRTATGGDAIHTYFDGALSVDDARIMQIMTNLKVKSKWDYKEKSKKQDAVIKELRDCFTAVFSDFNPLGTTASPTSPRW